MELFEDYKGSKDYDHQRIPIGCPIINGILLSYSQLNNTPLTSMSLIDAGCGTGNYSAQFAGKVGKLLAIDLNEPMLEQSRKKLTGQPGVEIKCGSITKLPVGDGEADALMSTQVIHLLDNASKQPSDCKSNGEWPNCIKFLEDAYRVLKPGRNAPIILNVDSQEQMHKSYWFLRALDEMGVQSFKEYTSKFIPVDKLTELMQQVGFKLGPIYTISNETVFREDVYNDYDGPFKEEWRNSTSVWCYLTKEDLAFALEKFKEWQLNGRLQEMVKASDESRKMIGSTTFVIG